MRPRPRRFRKCFDGGERGARGRGDREFEVASGGRREGLRAVAPGGRWEGGTTLRGGVDGRGNEQGLATLLEGEAGRAAPQGEAGREAPEGEPGRPLRQQ